MTPIRTSPTTLTVGIVVLLTTFLFGLFLEKYKPLENDEINSQYYSVNNISYGQIIKGQIREGNTAPLFYLLQKLISDAGGFAAPESWVKDVRVSRDPYPCILLRLQPILWMALSAALLFLYFGRQYSWAAGMLSLIIFYSIPTIPLYMSFARPYALWFFLTTLQTVIFLSLVRRRLSAQSTDTVPYAGLFWLQLVHLLLALTILLSLINIYIVCLGLWLFRFRRLRDYVGLMAVPSLVSFYYFQNAPRYTFNLAQPVSAYITENAPLELCLIAGVVLIIYSFYKKRKAAYGENLPTQALIVIPASLFFSLLISAFVLFFYLKWSFSDSGQWFYFAPRYSLFLAPAVIMAATHAVVAISRSLKDAPWFRLNCFVIILTMIIHVYLKNYSLWNIVEIFIPLS